LIFKCFSRSTTSNFILIDELRPFLPLKSLFTPIDQQMFLHAILNSAAFFLAMSFIILADYVLIFVIDILAHTSNFFIFRF
jgi:hypothetical protein